LKLLAGVEGMAHVTLLRSYLLAAMEPSWSSAWTAARQSGQGWDRKRFILARPRASSLATSPRNEPLRVHHWSWHSGNAWLPRLERLGL